MEEKVGIQKNGRFLVVGFDMREPNEVRIGTFKAMVSRCNGSAILDFGVCYPRETAEIAKLFGLVRPEQNHPIQLRVKLEKAEELIQLFQATKSAKNKALLASVVIFLPALGVLVTPVGMALYRFILLSHGDLGVSVGYVPQAYSFQGALFWLAALIFSSMPALLIADYFYKMAVKVFIHKEHARRVGVFEVAEI